MRPRFAVAVGVAGLVHGLVAPLAPTASRFGSPCWPCSSGPMAFGLPEKSNREADDDVTREDPQD